MTRNVDKSMFLYLFFICLSPSSNVTHAMLSPNPVLQGVNQWPLGATSMFVINVFLYINVLISNVPAHSIHLLT